jgi:hypothetical protein
MKWRPVPKGKPRGVVVAATLCLFMAGCGKIGTSIKHDMARYSSGKYKVTAYSGGKEVGAWESDGYPTTENGGRIVFFSKGKMHKLCGEIVCIQE